MVSFLDLTNSQWLFVLNAMKNTYLRKEAFNVKDTCVH